MAVERSEYVLLGEERKAAHLVLVSEKAVRARWSCGRQGVSRHSRGIGRADCSHSGFLKKGAEQILVRFGDLEFIGCQRIVGDRHLLLSLYMLDG